MRAIWFFPNSIKTFRNKITGDLQNIIFFRSISLFLSFSPSETENNNKNIAKFMCIRHDWTRFQNIEYMAALVVDVAAAAADAIYIVLTLKMPNENLCVYVFALKLNN